jgi:CBS domain-containing protein
MDASCLEADPLVIDSFDHATTVGKAMVKHPKVCSACVTVSEIRHLFEDSHVHAALVVDGDGALLSVVERTDIPSAAGGRDLAVEIGCLAGRTTSPELPLIQAREFMSEFGRRRLAVIDGRGRLLGLLCLKASGNGFCSDHDVEARATEWASVTPAIDFAVL